MRRSHSINLRGIESRHIHIEKPKQNFVGAYRSKETVIAIDSGHAVDSEPVIPSMKIPVSGMVANNEIEDEQQQEVQRKRLEKAAKVSCATCLSLSGAIITAGVNKPKSRSHGEHILFNTSVALALLTFFAGLGLLISFLFKDVKRIILLALTIVAVFSVLAGVVVLAINVYGTPWTPVRNNTSALWNWMIKVAHSIAPNLKFAYTPNSRISLLWDPWLDGCQFNYSSQDIRDNFPFHAKVADYVDLGTWLLPEPLVQNLDSFSITSVASNGVTWKTCKPCFSVFILEYFKEVEHVSWAKFLWHKHFALKYTIYAWLALNRGLKTADELSRRNILINHTCPLCFNHPESVDHLFFECDYGFTILVKLMPSLGNFLFRPRLLQLLEYLGDCDFLDIGKQNLYLFTVCCAIYYLWRERNERRFNSNFRSTSTLCSLIKHAVEHKAFKWKVWADLGGHSSIASAGCRLLFLRPGITELVFLAGLVLFCFLLALTGSQILLVAVLMARL
ncbi:hypothetical protein M5K25_008945 [Dendrobium thyrsiflorum]|uniref:Reverse transcriptase zinc-binding domain-containing protein n=1 Tax=Dendrobium thyrsiflorum TaxID=117978 RepID=A0ABD0VB63_DENTH